MALTQTTPYARNLNWTITCDELLLKSMHLTFKTAAKDGLPAQEPRLVVEYFDSEDTGGATTYCIRTKAVSFEGDANVAAAQAGEAYTAPAGACTTPLSEITYNAVIDRLEEWLDANV